MKECSWKAQLCALSSASTVSYFWRQHIRLDRHLSSYTVSALRCFFTVLVITYIKRFFVTNTKLEIKSLIVVQFFSYQLRAKEQLQLYIGNLSVTKGDLHFVLDSIKDMSDGKSLVILSLLNNLRVGWVYFSAVFPLQGILSCDHSFA